MDASLWVARTGCQQRHLLTAIPGLAGGSEPLVAPARRGHLGRADPCARSKGPLAPSPGYPTKKTTHDGSPPTLLLSISFLLAVMLTSLVPVAPVRSAVDCVTKTGHYGNQLTAQIFSCGYPDDPNAHIRLDISGPQDWYKVYDGEEPSGTWSGSVTATKAGTYTFTFTEDSYGDHYVTTAKTTLTADDVGATPTPKPTATPKPAVTPTAKPIATRKPAVTPTATPKPTLQPAVTPSLSPSPELSVEPSMGPSASESPSLSEDDPPSLEPLASPHESASPSDTPVPIAITQVDDRKDAEATLPVAAVVVLGALGAGPLLLLALRRRRRPRA